MAWRACVLMVLALWGCELVEPAPRDTGARWANAADDFHPAQDAGPDGGTAAGVSPSSSSMPSSSTDAPLAARCQPCRNNRCEEGGICTAQGRGRQVCTGAPCDDASTCTPGDDCMEVYDRHGWGVGRYCFPSSEDCNHSANPYGSSDGGSDGADPPWAAAAGCDCARLPTGHAAPWGVLGLVFAARAGRRRR